MAQATSHVRLMPLSDEHLEFEVELDADPEVMRYLGNGRARSRQTVEVVHRQRLAAGTPRWRPDPVGLTVLRLLVGHLLPVGAPILVAVLREPHEFKPRAASDG